MDHQVFEGTKFATSVAERISRELQQAPRTLVLTGGTAAAQVYRALADRRTDLSGIEVFFSDERCVPPTHEASNYRMVKELLKTTGVANIHRMRGEDPPGEAAAAYDRELTPIGDLGFELVLLGMGADCHIGALFPHSPALDATDLCTAVDRPDGLKGLTLTPRSITSGKRTLVMVAGENKAEAVRRALLSHEEPATCPARLLAERSGVTFLLDRGAASLL